MNHTLGTKGHDLNMAPRNNSFYYKTQKIENEFNIISVKISQ